MNKFFAFVCFVLFCISAQGQVLIPEFSPNVVDASNSLSAQEIAEINQSVDNMRNTADIMAAVFILDSLDGESIESLSERAFRQWKLGQQGKDNGLLFVIALKDRKSRFEVGYGLEGELTDVVTFRTQQSVFNPSMKEGRLKEGVINSLNFLAEVKTGQKTVVDDELFGSEKIDDFDEQKAAKTWLIYTFFIWFTLPFVRFVRRRLAINIANQNLRYDIKQDKAISVKPEGAGRFFVPGFLTINPGIFIFVGSGIGFHYVDYAIYILCPLIAFIIFVVSTKKYRSKAAWDKYIEKLRKEKADLIAKGYVKEISEGNFKYTKKFYESDDYKKMMSKVTNRMASSGGFSSGRSSGGFSGSSSSRSSSSSSSGGGRSGGGGSSSSW